MSDIRTSFALTMFKAVPGGYVYRARNRWLGGPPCHYRVNETQKAEIAAVTIPRRPIFWQAGVWIVFLLMVAAAGTAVWAYTGHDNPTGLDLLAWVLILAIEIVVGLQILRWWQLRRLRYAIEEMTELKLLTFNSRAGL